MKNAIKNYFKDYKRVVDHCTDFTKKHWKGTLVLGTMITIVELLYVKAYYNRKFKLDYANIPTCDFSNKESE